MCHTASIPSPAPGRLWSILAVVLVADAMDLLDSTLTMIAAPSIAADLGGGASLVTWLGASYALALGVLLVLGGRLGDKFGQRRMFLIGIAGFTLASLLCGLSTSPVMLIAARLAQGASGAFLIPQGMAILTATFPRDKLGAAFSVFGPVLGIAAVLGPVLGGFLIDADIFGLGWRAMFLINIVIGSAGFLAALKILPEIEVGRGVVLDLVGAALLALAMFAFIAGLSLGAETGWTGWPPIALALGAVSFILFCWRQASAANPLIEPSLLANRGFTSGLLVGFGFFAAVSGLCFVISLFFQGGLGRSPTGAALGLIPMAIGIVVASGACAPLLARLGRWLVVSGLLITLAAAAFLFAVVASHGGSVGYWPLVAPIFLLGLGMGACFATIYDVALGDIATEEAGSASGSLSAVQQLAASTGIAVMTTVFFSVASHADQGQAMLLSLAVVAAIVLVCLGLVWLMPAAAPAEQQ
ncbi:MFS transporter [Consotaella salsifontis]|uniref:Drug resistance transporter, EmrB/QacA subfamily n=1 Tax=Consotaella salsifontis TaxID=1365950 RepID=A0A1T4STP6_9HYPH|nr:MFS transporter [Consotaella salsifontis]SKA31553.1 drug resistance transporter, EmrB/QacA subfamily [Consotaella salsifontis]